MISISDVINISVTTPPAGIAQQNVSNLACFTKETPINTITNFATYTSTQQVAADWGTSSLTYAASIAVFAQSPNIITGGGVFIAIPVGSSETTVAALARVIPLVYFGAFATTYSDTSANVLLNAAAAQAAFKLYFIESSTQSDLVSGGLLYNIQQQTLTYARGLFHNDSTQAQAFVWGYASRAMGVNFAGTNTTNTMHLKQISGVNADTAMTETILSECATVGADAYVSIAGRPSVMSYGANNFFDEMFNRAWFKMALEVAGFNALAQSTGKVPQTEDGMNVLKSAYRQVCEQARSNGMIGAGAWNGSDTFGSPEDFNRNISDRGYYIYSQPISQQSSADRSARKAPLIQIAVKEAGAIHSSSVIVNINR